MNLEVSAELMDARRIVRREIGDLCETETETETEIISS